MSVMYESSVKQRKYLPLVSIIIVNYNHSDVTCELINSLNKISYTNFEIIVVDNLSQNDDPSIIKLKYPGVHFVESPINYGFAAGNNYGIMAAHGKYVLLLNFDTIVTDNFLEPLVDAMENDSAIGAASPKIRFFHTPDTLQYAGYTSMNPYTLRNFAIGNREIDHGQCDVSGETEFTHGAAMLVSMDAIKKVGMMSYAFFLYYEEADWCERMKKAGYKMYYVYNSLIYHKESIAIGKLSPLKIYYLNRNRLIYLRRNVYGKIYYIAIIYQIFIAIPRNSFRYLVRGKLKLFYAYYRAIGWHLKNMLNKEIHENPML